MSFEKNQPLFYRKLPKTERSSPNACFLRGAGDIPGKKVAVIQWKGEPWIVDAAEIWSVPMAMSLSARKYHDQIESVRESCKNNIVKMAAALKMSKETLRKRMAFVKNHLRVAGLANEQVAAGN